MSTSGHYGIAANHLTHPCATENERSRERLHLETVERSAPDVDDLAAARGLINALLIVIVFWAMVFWGFA